MLDHILFLFLSILIRIISQTKGGGPRDDLDIQLFYSQWAHSKSDRPQKDRFWLEISF